MTDPRKLIGLLLNLLDYISHSRDENKCVTSLEDSFLPINLDSF